MDFIMLSLSNTATPSHSDVTVVSEKLFGAGFTRLLIAKEIT